MTTDLDKEFDLKINDKSFKIAEIKEGFNGVSPTEILITAKQILLGIAIVFFSCLAMYAIIPVQGAVLLEICKTVLPPLATLIIAFYFKS